MCEMLQLSRAAYYRHWVEKEPDQAEMAVRDAVQKECLSHRFYGYRRIAVGIQRHGWVVSTKVVRRIMHNDNLLAARRRQFVPTTDSQHGFRIHPNLARSMQVEMSDQLWVADMTYIRLQGEFVFLAVVLDAWSRSVIGWQLGRTLKAELPLAALEQAIQMRQPKPGLVHHNDGGSQYACHDYVDRLETIGAVMSMSAPGRPWENAICESFMNTLKKEEIDARAYSNLEHLEQNIEEFMERVYNRVRLHSALGYRSPEEFENQVPGGNWRPATLLLHPRQEVSV
jgi:putative transposase